MSIQSAVLRIYRFTVRFAKRFRTKKSPDCSGDFNFCIAIILLLLLFLPVPVQ